MYYWAVHHDVEDNVFHECIILVVINTWWGLAGYGLLGYIMGSRCKINLVNRELSYSNLAYYYWHLVLLFWILSAIFFFFWPSSWHIWKQWRPWVSPECATINFILSHIGLEDILGDWASWNMQGIMKNAGETFCLGVASVLFPSWWIRKWNKRRSQKELCASRSTSFYGSLPTEFFWNI